MLTSFSGILYWPIILCKPASSMQFSGEELSLMVIESFWTSVFPWFQRLKKSNDIMSHHPLSGLQMNCWPYTPPQGMLTTQTCLAARLCLVVNFGLRLEQFGVFLKIFCTSLKENSQNGAWGINRQPYNHILFSFKRDIISSSFDLMMNSFVHLFPGSWL